MSQVSDKLPSLNRTQLSHGLRQMLWRRRWRPIDDGHSMLGGLSCSCWRRKRSAKERLCPNNEMPQDHLQNLEVGTLCSSCLHAEMPLTKYKNRLPLPFASTDRTSFPMPSKFRTAEATRAHNDSLLCTQLHGKQRVPRMGPLTACLDPKQPFHSATPILSRAWKVASRRLQPVVANYVTARHAYRGLEPTTNSSVQNVILAPY